MGIRLRCDDVTLRHWLEAWVGEMRLAPPAPLTLVARAGAGVDGDSDDTRAPFLQPQVEIRAGPPQGDVRIRWLDGPARGIIPRHSRTAYVEIGPEALTDRERLARGFLTVVLIFLLRRGGWHHVHAALARDPRGREWLFAGNAKSGKSTTAALLATWGWEVGSDDVTFLARDGEDVRAFAQRAPVALRSDGLALLGLVGGAPTRGGRKRAFFPEELGGSWIGSVTPRIIAMPCVEGSVTRVEPLPARAALVELVRWSASVALEPDLAEEHLGLLTALARQAAGYRLTLAPDVFARRDLLMDLIP